MRQIGTFDDERQARRFNDFLLTEDIQAVVEHESDGWAIWVREEDQLAEATRQLASFRANPSDGRYANAEKKAEELRQKKRRELEKARKNVVEMRDNWSQRSSGSSPLTIAIIIICSLLSLEASLMTRATSADGKLADSVVMRSLLMLDPVHHDELFVEAIAKGWNQTELNRAQDSWSYRLLDIQKGQIWRTVTPTFLHGGLAHLLMNMWTLWVIGRVLEQRYGTAWYGAMILFIAIPSTMSGGLAPMEWGGSPFGLGFSGVLFGFVGFVWMKSVYDPSSGLYMPPMTLLFVMIFLVAGITGLDRELFKVSLDNWGHGIGLLTGMAIGYFPHWLSKLRR